MDLSVKQLEEAVAVRRQIEQLQSRLSSLLGRSGASGGAMSSGSSTGGTVTRKSSGNGRRKGRRGTMSPEGRARIAAAARERWARIRQGSGGGSQGTTSASKKTSAKKSGKRGLSEEGRRKLSQMMKARWAARRKAQGK